MDGTIRDPESAHERIAAWKARVDKLAADTQAMSDRFQALRITASDPNGLAEVTVDSSGAMVDLKLTDRITRVSPSTVAQAVMSTLADARNRLADRSEEIVADTVGADSGVGRAIAENVSGHFRSSSAAVEPRRTAAASDGEDGEYDVSSDLGRG
ncbi:YbaB/EbfC family nucleoid-associated protein [Actinokineospora soli]|uniref:YbaB/EbfC family nucleoid-associated protein n=1 Tax=Actinokineospora soli TaxID=1048753 RepID=A0ABW2TML9_9PSEU